MFRAVPWQSKSYLVALAGFAGWVCGFLLLIYLIANHPYIGATFEGLPDEKAIVVVEVKPDGPAEKAGLTVGTVITAINDEMGNRLTLSGLEPILGRHEINSYAMMDQVVAYKTAVWDFLTKPTFTLQGRDGDSYLIAPTQTEPLGVMQVWSFVTLFQCLLVIIITAGIMGFGAKVASVRLLVASGLGQALNSFCGAYLSTRELTIPPHLFELTVGTASVGSAVFAYSLLALLCHFPSPISRRVPFAFLALLLGAAVQVVVLFKLFSFPFHTYQMSTLIPLPFAVAASGIQWVRSRDKPLERASVMWFFLTIYGVVGWVVLLYSVPILLGTPPLIPPGLANYSLTLIFIGIALGTLRYRLFDIHRIWWRTIAWFFAGLSMVAVDFLLVSQLDLEQKQALPIALLIAGWLYFPLRQRIVDYFGGIEQEEIEQHIPRLIDTFSSLKNLEEVEGRFLRFLANTYQAMEIGSVDLEPCEKARVERNGLSLRVPAIARTGSVELIGKRRGRKLFSTADARQVDVFIRLVRNINAANLREAQRLQMQREHIARDLHDEVGGKLLSLIYRSTDAEYEREARQVLRALKEALLVVEDTQSVDYSAAWQEIKQDVQDRAEQAGIQLELRENFASPRVLSAREYVNFKRAVFEVITNAIKYCDNKVITLETEIDGAGAISLTCRNRFAEIGEEGLTSQRGLNNIEVRMKEIGGTVEVERSNEGTGPTFTIRLDFPMSQ